MAMRFYMTPGSCSTGIHVLLETLELPFEAWIVNLPAGEHRRPEYLALNPKGTIPTLVLDDGTALTDFISIAWWLGRQHPRARLLPDDALGQARVLSVLSHVVGTVHGQGYTRIFTTDEYLPPDADEAARSAVQARGREIVAAGFAVLDAALQHTPWIAGETFGVADAAVFYVCFWAERISLPLPNGLARHLRQMRERPVVQQVLREEGYR